MQFSVTSTAATVLAAVAGYLVLRFVQTRVLSPLRHIPGPFLASFTEYWLMLIDIAGFRTTVIHSLHQKYGPAVRIGPNEVSFSDVSVVKEIYGPQGNYPKAPWYEGVSLKPLGIFSLRDKAAYRSRRNLLSHAFSVATLNATTPIVCQRVAQLKNVIEGYEKKAVNVLEMFRRFSLDVVGELFLGSSFGALDTPDEPIQFMEDIDRHFMTSGMEGAFPLPFKLVSLLPIPSLQFFLGARERVAKYGTKAYEDYINRYGTDSGRKDLLTKILTTKSDEPPLTKRKTSIEIGNLVFAGTDTTSTTLTYLFWELTKHPEWQSRIRDELPADIALPGDGSQSMLQTLTALPILDAVIQEALRLHPAAPASLPRVPPPGGAVLSGFEIPEGTVVSMQCYTTQRDPRFWSNPDAFTPERWFDRERLSAETMQMFMPFSAGQRLCLGKHLAMLELKLVTATLLKAFEVSAAKETTEDSMEMRDHFLVMPKAGRCDLVFQAV